METRTPDLRKQSQTGLLCEFRHMVGIVSDLPNRRAVSLYGLWVIVRADFDARLHMIDGPLTARLVMGVSRNDMARLVTAFYPADGRRHPRPFGWRAVAGWESGDKDYRMGSDARRAYARLIDAVVIELSGGQWRARTAGTRRWRCELRRIA